MGLARNMDKVGLGHVSKTLPYDIAAFRYALIPRPSFFNLAKLPTLKSLSPLKLVV